MGILSGIELSRFDLFVFRANSKIIIGELFCMSHVDNLEVTHLVGKPVQIIIIGDFCLIPTSDNLRRLKIIGINLAE